MKKYVRSASDTDKYMEFSNTVSRVAQSIHDMLDFNNEDMRDTYMSSPSAFVDDAIPEIEKLLEEAKEAYADYYSSI